MAGAGRPPRAALRSQLLVSGGLGYPSRQPPISGAGRWSPGTPQAHARAAPSSVHGGAPTSPKTRAEGTPPCLPARTWGSVVTTQHVGHSAGPPGSRRSHGPAPPCRAAPTPRPRQHADRPASLPAAAACGRPCGAGRQRRGPPPERQGCRPPAARGCVRAGGEGHPGAPRGAGGRKPRARAAALPRVWTRRGGGAQAGAAAGGRAAGDDVSPPLRQVWDPTSQVGLIPPSPPNPHHHHRAAPRPPTSWRRSRP